MTVSINQAKLPLAGIRILDLTAVLLGPYATQMLAEYGADVIKIEAPSGDTTRYTGPVKEKGMAAMFLGLNRSKRSVVLDLKQADARDALLHLVDSADVLVHSMRPQKMAALHLSPDTLRARNPKLIVVAAYGFAQGGPYSGRPAYDDIIQATSGLAGAFEQVTGTPAYVPTVIADKTTALFTAQAILMALMARTRDGVGSEVEVTMFESMVGFMLSDHFYGAQFEPPLSPPGYVRLMSKYRRPFKTLDGYVAMMPYTNANWGAFFPEIGRPELVADQRFIGIAARTENIEALYTILDAAVATRTTATWLEVCERLDVPAARINKLSDLLTDPHLTATGFFKTMEDERMGTVHHTSAPLRFTGMEPVMRMPPRLGEHTAEVLRESGLAPDVVDALLAGSAVQWKG